jgi:5-methylthioadenosine/S-adenosylhomocysteine deaminase
MTNQILIKGGILLSMVEGDIPRQADVVIEGGQIVSIRDSDGQGKLHPEATILNAEGCVVMPGLINAHTHTPFTFYRSTSDNVSAPHKERVPSFPPGKNWRENLSPQDHYWASYLAIAEMIRCGTTAFIDMYHDMDQVAKAVVDSGMRAALGWEIMSFRVDPDEWLPYDESVGKRTFEESAKFAAEWDGKGDGRVMALIAPHESGGTCAEPWLTRAAKLAEELDVGITVHVAESKWEVEICRERYDLTPVEVIERAGILGRHVVGAHSLYLTDSDIAILAQADYTAAACIGGYIKVAHDHTPVPRLLEAGVNVALGTDSAETNNNLNLWDEIHLNATLHGYLARDASIVSDELALRLATVGGAKALGMEHELGTLEVGKLADIITVDLQKPHMKPAEGVLLGNLAYSASGHEVRDVIVDGRILMRDWEIVSFNEQEVLEQADKRVRDLRAAAGLPERYHRP